MIRLSAFVCVQNQDARLAECLRKLSFCDEIVVVVDRCTDRSREIARRAGATVIDGIFPLESQRKAAGAEACTGEWILEVEAEDLVDAHLAWEIRCTLQMKPAGDWYELPIDNYVGETLVREGWAGALSARAEPRLYKRGLKTWSPRRVNAPAAIVGRAGGSLKGAIRRTVGRDIGGVVERLNRFAALHAEDVAETGRRSPAVVCAAAGVGMFLKGYLVRGGWREGRLGLMVALLCGLFPMLSQMRAGELIAARKAALADATRAAPLGEVVGMGR